MPRNLRSARKSPPGAAAAAAAAAAGAAAAGDAAGAVAAVAVEAAACLGAAVLGVRAKTLSPSRVQVGQHLGQYKSQGRVLLDPAVRCLICGIIGANNSLCQCLVGTTMAC